MSNVDEVYFKRGTPKDNQYLFAIWRDDDNDVRTLVFAVRNDAELEVVYGPAYKEPILEEWCDRNEDARIAITLTREIERLRATNTELFDRYPTA